MSWPTFKVAIVFVAAAVVLTNVAIAAVLVLR